MYLENSRETALRAIIDLEIFRKIEFHLIEARDKTANFVVKEQCS